MIYYYFILILAICFLTLLFLVWQLKRLNFPLGINKFLSYLISGRFCRIWAKVLLISVLVFTHSLNRIHGGWIWLVQRKSKKEWTGKQTHHRSVHVPLQREQRGEMFVHSVEPVRRVLRLQEWAEHLGLRWGRQPVFVCETDYWWRWCGSRSMHCCEHQLTRLHDSAFSMSMTLC